MQEEEEVEEVGVGTWVRDGDSWKSKEKGKEEEHLAWPGYLEGRYLCLLETSCCVSFAVVALLPCGANGDSMCVMSEEGLSQHPKVASKTLSLPFWLKSLNIH